MRPRRGRLCQPFDPDAVYALVCDNFLMNGNDTYYTLKNVKEAEGTQYLNNGSGVKARDAVAMYIDSQLDDVVGETYAKPQGRIAVMSFTDVAADADYAAAVSWAVEHGITNGTNAEGTTFSPDVVCARGHIVTFLHRGTD